jgi:hypothetical protein
MRTYENYDEEKTRTIISLDIDNLEIEVHNLSTIVYDYGIYKSYAYYELARAKAKLDRHKAELSATVRTDPGEYGLSPPNLNDAIKEYVLCNKTTIELEDEWIEKKLVLDKIESACNSLETKGYSLGQAIKIWIRNYYADNPIAGEDKKAIERMDYEEAYEELSKRMKERKEKQNGEK